MCSRSKDEPLLAYWFRQFKEEPLRVLICGTLAAMCYLYVDGQNLQEEYRADAKESNAALVEQIKLSTQVMGEIKAQLILLNGRVEHLEREHEAARNNK